jgi:hypothetical protein
MRRHAAREEKRMADVRPLPGIRYAADADLDALVTPPYDVISPESQARYSSATPTTSFGWSLGAMSRATTRSTTSTPARRCSSPSGD